MLTGQVGDGLQLLRFSEALQPDRAAEPVDRGGGPVDLQRL